MLAPPEEVDRHVEKGDRLDEIGAVQAQRAAVVGRDDH